MEPIDSNKLSDINVESRPAGLGASLGPLNPLQSGSSTGMLMPNGNQQSVASLPNAPTHPTAPHSDHTLAVMPSSQGTEETAEDIVWVDRAKSIVAQTQGDPHKQAELLQQLSALYLKERFGREAPPSKG